jgi:hypothetical protein
MITRRIERGAGEQPETANLNDHGRAANELDIDRLLTVPNARWSRHS